MEEVLIEDDLNILDILEFRFPKKTYNRGDCFDEMGNFTVYRQFLMRKPSVLAEI